MHQTIRAHARQGGWPCVSGLCSWAVGKHQRLRRNGKMEKGFLSLSPPFLFVFSFQVPLSYSHLSLMSSQKKHLVVKTKIHIYLKHKGTLKYCHKTALMTHFSLLSAPVYPRSPTLLLSLLHCNIFLMRWMEVDDINIKTHE